MAPTSRPVAIIRIPDSPPAITTPATLACTTRLRRGVARKVGVIVWCRNSPQIAITPRISVNSEPIPNAIP